MLTNIFYILLLFSNKCNFLKQRLNNMFINNENDYELQAYVFVVSPVQSVLRSVEHSGHRCCVKTIGFEF